MGEHLFSGLRELEPPSRPLEELRMGVAFKLPDLDRHRRRREVQLLGRAREGQVPRGAFEHPQLPESGVLHPRRASRIKRSINEAVRIFYFYLTREGNSVFG